MWLIVLGSICDGLSLEIDQALHDPLGAVVAKCVGHRLNYSTKITSRRKQEKTKNQMPFLCCFSCIYRK
jgi:hypothetical protein